MAAWDERTRTELPAPAPKQTAGPAVSARFDEAILRLARLIGRIGRQIAREEFERRDGKRVKGATGVTKGAKSSSQSG
jgi:hypothetical protein